MTWNDKSYDESYDSTFLPGFKSIGEKKYFLASYIQVKMKECFDLI